MSKKIKPIVLTGAFSPLTENQEKVSSSFLEKHQVLIGSAGTGKTYCAIKLALETLVDTDNDYRHILIVRSSVSCRDVGFLPGTIDDKSSVFEIVYREMVNSNIKQLCTSDSEKFADNYDKLKAMGVVSFVNTSFLRGVTYDNTIVILDEIQNYSFGELDTCLTRLGNNSKVIMCGDFGQNDLKYNESGLGRMLGILNNMPENYFNIVEFTTNDIVRSGFCKDYLITKERVEYDKQEVSERNGVGRRNYKKYRIIADENE